MLLFCSVCDASINESEIHQHLRSHDINQYKRITVLSSVENLLKFAEYALVTSFNSTFVAFKSILDSKDYTAYLLPSLEITSPAINELEFELVSSNQNTQDYIPIKDVPDLIKIIQNECQRVAQGSVLQPYERNHVLNLHCTTCDRNFGAASMYSHLRKFHGLIKGGRQKDQKTRPNFDSIHIKLATNSIRQVLIRTMKNAFNNFVRHWNELDVQLKTECFELVVSEEKHATTSKLLVKISSVNLKDIPYAILYLWNENQQREQFEDFDYLGMSVGEFPLKHSGEVDPMNIFNVGGKNYQWLVNIGKGGFGVCCKIKMENTQHLFACKITRMDEAVVDEAKIHQSLVHENVVRLIDHGVDSDRHVVMIMELCKCSVKDLQRLKQRFSDAMLKDIVQGTNSALCYLQLQGVIHRDVKPANILVTEANVIKLCDFGLAIVWDLKKIDFSRAGTVYYMAPEVVARRGWSFASDSWALGVLTYELAAGKRLFDGQTNDEIYEQILSFNQISLPAYWDIELTQFLGAVLDPDETNRSTADDLLVFDYFMDL